VTVEQWLDKLIRASDLKGRGSAPKFQARLRLVGRVAFGWHQNRTDFFVLSRPQVLPRLQEFDPDLTDSGLRRVLNVLTSNGFWFREGSTAQNAKIAHRYFWTSATLKALGMVAPDLQSASLVASSCLELRPMVGMASGHSDHNEKKEIAFGEDIMVGSVSTKTVPATEARLYGLATKRVSAKAVRTKGLPAEAIPTKAPEPLKWDGNGLPLYGSVASRETAAELLRAQKADADTRAWLQKYQPLAPKSPFSAESIAKRTGAILPRLDEDREAYRARAFRETTRARRERKLDAYFARIRSAKIRRWVVKAKQQAMAAQALDSVNGS